MTWHFHGTPITPRSVLGRLAGRCFCVSYAAPQDIAVCHEIGQSVMLDNGAFSLWRKGKPTDWPGYYEWARRWLEHPTTWAVIPDVIDGDEAANDALIAEWADQDLPRGYPVWHMHESLNRLRFLVAGHERVCIGSSGQYAVLDSPQWRRRMDAAMNAVCSGATPWLHMLRGMSFAGREYPFASLDSTDVARNHNRPRNDALEMALRWDGRQCPPRWTPREQLEMSA